ncbi:Replication factor A protein 1 [Physocladia obscura]|uniref:Replication protein A subunit n=1 Tax=Physocladia obscura TaxID=109957 RepID=A0AAD5XE30_9FUNG|nr:Replication factor A protein 1 [Physocladia obscura]
MSNNTAELQRRLTRGSIYRLATDVTESIAEDTALTLQVLNIKKLDHNQSSNSTNPVDERFRVIVSDGSHAMQGMLATQHNHLIHENQLVRNSVVIIDRLVSNVVGGKRILIILNLVILNPGQTDCPRFGSPTSITPTASVQQVPAQYQQQQQQQQHQEQQALPHYQQQAAQYQQPQNQPQQQQQAQRNQQQHRPIQQHQTNSSDLAVFPINALSPYQNKWTIRARVVSKSDIRKYRNMKGDGQLFSCVFGDASGEIRATGFNDVVDQVYEMLVENKVYYISKAQIKNANRQFTNGVNNDYEMTLDLGTMITECTDSAPAPAIMYNRVMLDSLLSYEKDATVDIIAVVTDVMPVTDITTKAGNQIKKREITVVDESAYSVRVTLWGRQAENFPELVPSADGADVAEVASKNPVCIFKGCKVNDFGGRSLGMTSGSSIVPNADMKDVHGVRGWWVGQANGGASAVHINGYNGVSGSGGMDGGQRVSGVRGIRSVAFIGENSLGHGEKPDWLTIRGTIGYITQEKMFYPACQSPNCQKKVTEDNSGWRCESCKKSFPTPKYRYIFNAKVLDWSGEQWISFFNDQGESMFGVPATDMQIIQQNDPDKFKELLDAVLWKQFDIRARVKLDTYGDEARVRVSAQSSLPIKYGSAAIDLCEAIEAMG